MAACKEGIVLEAHAWEKTTEPPIWMGATGDNMFPHVDAGRANEERPQTVGVPGWAGRTLGLSREPELVTRCHTPFRERGNEAFIRVPRMFKSYI
jgi:hypothetical protein